MCVYPGGGMAGGRVGPGCGRDEAGEIARLAVGRRVARFEV